MMKSRNVSHKSSLRWRKKMDEMDDEDGGGEGRLNEKRKS